MSLSVKGLVALILAGILLIGLVGFVGGQIINKTPDWVAIESKEYAKGCFSTSLSEECALTGDVTLDAVLPDGTVKCSNNLEQKTEFAIKQSFVSKCEVTILPVELPIEDFPEEAIE